MKKQKSFWREVSIGTVATVLGGIILAIIPSTRDYLFAVFNLIGRFFEFLGLLIVFIWNFLKSPSGIPTGVVIFLVVLSLPTVIIPIWSFLDSLSENSQHTSKPSLYEYREDEIYGVVWKWTGIPPAIPNGISGFCPTCATRLVYKPDYGYDGEDSIFFCETCQKNILARHGDLQFVLSAIWRQIERKINTGEWKQVVASRKNDNP